MLSTHHKKLVFFSLWPAIIFFLLGYYQRQLAELRSLSYYFGEGLMSLNLYKCRRGIIYREKVDFI